MNVVFLIIENEFDNFDNFDNYNLNMLLIKRIILGSENWIHHLFT